MSVAVSVLKAQEESIDAFENVVGYVIVAVVKDPGGDALTIERAAAVYADSREDNDAVEGFIKAIEKKLAEALPEEPEAEPEVKLWVPN